MTPAAGPDRKRPDLAGIVRDVAADRERWAHRVHHDARQRQFELLHRDADIEVWMVCWMPGQDTGFHDHDASAAAITVVAGQVSEQRLVIDGANTTRSFLRGETMTAHPWDIHRVQHAGAEPSVTIHAYSPPLARMGQYEIGSDGTLRRHAQDAVEELRPVAAA